MDNTELAKLILKQVDTHPESFWMGSWGHRTPCGTVACLAGHALLLSGYEITSEIPSGGPGYRRPDGTFLQGGYAEEAQKVLGMSGEERFADPGDVWFSDIFLDIEGGLARFRALAEKD